MLAEVRGQRKFAKMERNKEKKRKELDKPPVLKAPTANTNEILKKN